MYLDLENIYALIPFIQKYLISIYLDLNVWYYKNIAKYFYFKPKLIEPEDTKWIDISSLIYLNNRDYELVHTNIHKDKNVEQEYYSFYKTFYSNYIYSEEEEEDKGFTKEHVFVAKYDENKYLCRVCFPGHVKIIPEDTDISTNNDTEISFLYVEYFHPTKMSQPIILPFPNGMVQPFNELFTPAFVLRQLQTQTQYYYYDMDYKLTILDQDLRTVQLNSNQYIFLHKYNYDIIERK
jgi:hypothetical protein